MEGAYSLPLLVKLGQTLRGHRYYFTTVTPETHARVLEHSVDFAKLSQPLHVLREFFGWNRPLPKDLIPQDVLEILEAAALLRPSGSLVKSALRVSTLGDKIFLHSSFPTDDESSVFFGPDSYRFVQFLKRHPFSAESVLDIGCGSGVGIIGAGLHAQKNLFCDINEQALILAQANAAINEVEGIFCQSDILKTAPQGCDLLIANPPFIIDGKNRQYRHGGENYGAEIALKIVKESLEYLKPGGRLALYTGACMVQGQDVFLKELGKLLPDRRFRFYYEEIDVDIFGEELSNPAYHDVERIAAVGMLLDRDS